MSGAVEYLFNEVTSRRDLYSDKGYGYPTGPGAMCTSPTVACSDQNARALSAYFSKVDKPLESAIGPDDVVLLAVAPVRLAIGAGLLFRTEHYAARLTGVGLDVLKVESAVGAEVVSIRSAMSVGAPVSGRITVDNVPVIWRAQLLNDGRVSVGTIHPDDLRWMTK
jgi:hypothetical protein